MNDYFTPPITKRIKLNINTLHSNSNRDSNIELLRIVCMFFIVLLHFLILDAYPQIWNPKEYSREIVTASILNGFLYVAVNCYILISGYFGVKFKWRSILKIYLLCFFYGLLGYLIHIGISGDNFGRTMLYNSIFCISHSKLWYVRCYFILILISPILNTAINNISKRDFQQILLVLTILNIYFGHIWQTPNFNLDGYNIEQFIYLYFIGQYIQRYVSINKLRNHRILLLSSYIGCAITYGLLTILWHKIELPIWTPFAYNTPVMIIGAVSFFLLFLTITIQNKWINYMATFTFPIYVVHCGSYLSDIIHNYARHLIVQDV